LLATHSDAPAAPREPIVDETWPFMTSVFYVVNAGLSR
jgi:hypothetical protein